MRKLLVAAAIGWATTTALQAQTFPEKPVKVVLPFPPGTGPDIVMRLVGEKLSRVWGQAVVVENKPGANGFIAMESAKKAAPDGYTLVQVDAPVMAVRPHLFKRLPYDPKDFEPVGSLYRTYTFITVAGESKWKDVGDLIESAKAKPGQLTFGSSGVGGNLHLGGVMLENRAGIRMTHVPYKETPQIYAAISMGDVDWALGTASTTASMLQSRKVKYLAIAAPRRSARFPDVPTVAEARGPENFELQTWVALFAPRGVPKSVIDRINADIARVLDDPDVRQRLEASDFEPLTQTPAELQKTVNDDSAKFRTLLKGMNISLD